MPRKLKVMWHVNHTLSAFFGTKGLCGWIWLNVDNMLMFNLSLVKENRSWLIMWVVTLAAGRCSILLFTAWLHSSQIIVYLSCWLSLVNNGMSMSSSVAAADDIIHFVFLSAWNYASFEAFSTLWSWLILQLSKEVQVTEQIHLGD